MKLAMLFCNAHVDTVCLCSQLVYIYFYNIVSTSLFFIDDIFSPNTAKPVAKAPQKSKKTPPSQETSTAADSSNIFDDPLNALGGN